MVIFFNDTFIEDEYANYAADQFINSVQRFLSFSNIIADKRKKYNHSKIYFKADLGIKNFFEEITDKTQAQAFLQALKKLNIKYWNINETQEDNLLYYFYDTSKIPPVSTDINGKSLAEAARVKRLEEPHVLTLNLPDLQFSNIHVIHVNIISLMDREDVNSITLDCADCEHSLGFWIDKAFQEDYNYRDYERAPLDKESCLVNQFKFTKVDGKKSQGRQIYRDKSNRLWYIDNFHKGEGAHIEVFNAQGIHEGEADLEGQIDFSKRDPSKSIDIQ